MAALEHGRWGDVGSEREGESAVRAYICRPDSVLEAADAAGAAAVERYEALLEQCGRGMYAARAELRAVLWERRPACPPACRARVWEALLGCARTSDAEDQRLCEHIAGVHAHYAQLARAEAEAARRRFQSGADADAEEETMTEEGFVVVRRSVDQYDRVVLQRLDDVRKDVCRMHPEGCGRLAQTPWVQALAERVLFAWSVDDADGYFQGLNDLLVPCVVALVAEEVASAGGGAHSDGALMLSAREVAQLSPGAQTRVEARSLRLLGAVAGALDVQRGASRLHSDGMLRVFDAVLRWAHPQLRDALAACGVLPVCYALRWCLCLMARELPVPALLLLWDALLADPGDGPLGTLPVYVAAAHLLALAPLVLAACGSGGRACSPADSEAVTVLLTQAPVRWDARAVRRLVAAAVALRARHLDSLEHARTFPALALWGAVTRSPPAPRPVTMADVPAPVPQRGGDDNDDDDGDYDGDDDSVRGGSGVMGWILPFLGFPRPLTMSTLRGV